MNRGKLMYRISLIIVLITFYCLCTLSPETVNRFDYPPILSNHYADTTVRQFDTVTIAASAYDSNPDGSIVRVLVDYGGDGIWDDSSEATTAHFRIANPAGGPLMVVWGAKDDDGVVATDTFVVLFNLAPKSLVMTSPLDGGKASWSSFDGTTGKGKVMVSFNATDPDGDALTYSLSIGRDVMNLTQVYQGSATTYTVSSLAPDSVYFWRLSAMDPMLQTVSIAGKFQTLKSTISVISDLENGTGENNFGSYWYVYDDHVDGGNSTITNLTKNNDGNFNFLPTAGAGNTVTGGTPGYGALIVFKLGSIKPSNANGSWGNMIGAGCMLAELGSYLNLTGAQKIEFYAKVERPKGTSSSALLRCEVCTYEFDGENGGDYGYYHIDLSISGNWAKYTIPLDTVNTGNGKLVQWDWSVQSRGRVPFNKTKVTRLQWCISEDSNLSSWFDASGALYLDDISISPFTLK
jgi:hypothetical protein